MKVSELDFTARQNAFGGSRALVSFDNGLSASVITGGHSYSSDERPYEIAVMSGDSVCYDTPITDDVCGYLDEDEANKILDRIEALEWDTEK